MSAIDATDTSEKPAYQRLQEQYYEENQKEPVCVRIPDELLRTIDDCVETDDFDTRSDAIRTAVNKLCD